MARLKIGNAIQFEAKLDPIPVIGPGLIEQEKSESLTVEDFIQMVIEAMPKAEASKEVDLTPIQNQLNEVNEALDELAVRVDEHRHEDLIPEVKVITNVKDIGPEMLEKFDAMLEYSEESTLNQINQMKDTISNLHYTIEKQKTHKYILYGLVILTIFFHFI